MTRTTAVVLTIALLQASAVMATSIAWTGILNNNQWETADNWNPAQVPGANDDVTIVKGNVQLTAATSVASLTMGGAFAASANLTLFKAFFVSGTMTVQGNGNLIINTGLDTVSGTVDVAGAVQVIDGTLGGEWTIGKIGKADLGNANEKTFAGCNFVANGDLTLGGVIVLNQSSVVTINAAVSASSNLMIQAQDKTTVLFDASKATMFTYSTGLLSIQAPTKIGNFDFKSGNVTLFNSMSFVQLLTIPAGSYVAAIGAITAKLSLGVAGAGTLTAQCSELALGPVSMSGSIVALSGSVLFNAKSNVSGILTIDGAAVVATAAVSVEKLAMMSGSISGASTLSAGGAFLQSKGFDVNSAVEVTKTFAVEKSVLAFGQQGKFTLAAGATGTVSDAFQLTGAPYLPGFYNQGTLTVNADVASQNINIRGSGKIVATGASITITAALVEQSEISLSSKATFLGSSSMMHIGAVSGATVTGKFGDYALECTGACKNVATTSTETAPIVKFSFTA
jgi:hypothetical protein